MIASIRNKRTATAAALVNHNNTKSSKLRSINSRTTPTAYLGSFLKWANLGLFFVYFPSFQSNITILQEINVKKSLRYTHRDLNSQPFDYESPLLATGPGFCPAYLGSYC